MSIPQEDKEEIYQMFSLIVSEACAALCDNIERDMRACIVDLLLQLGPMLARQNGQSIDEYIEKFDKYRQEKNKELANENRVKGFVGS